MASAQKLMRNYTGATELSKSRHEVPPKDPASPAEEATLAQQKFDWVQSPVTQSVFKALHDEASDLINTSIALSVAYPTTQNHLQIIHNLVRVNQINNILNKYAKAS